LTTSEDPEFERTVRRFAEALAQLGNGSSPKRLAERVKQLEMGLPAEDHFMLLLSWLDRCHMVHRLDQLQLPLGEASAAFRVPDLLAVFFHEGGETPVLIEVKKTKKDKLKWSEKYLRALQHYADVLQLPLLVAVQWQDGGLWTLNDVGVFWKANVNYHLDAGSAFDNNLMCELAGDFLCSMRVGVGMHMTLKKLSEPERDADGVIVSMDAAITDAHFEDANGDRLDSLGAEINALFLAVDQEVTCEETADAVIQRFVITDKSPSVFAQHLLLPAVLGPKALNIKPPVQWRKLIEHRQFTFSGRDVARATALAKTLTHQSKSLRPHIWPSVLGPE
jgi:Holliday junction resolvase